MRLDENFQTTINTQLILMVNCKMNINKQVRLNVNCQVEIHKHFVSSPGL